MRKMFALTVSVVLIILGGVAWKLTARSAYESAEYSVVIADGEFEVRRYPELMLVSTEMRFDGRGEDGSFMRLFRYISGRNDKEQKVSMTTPVLMEDAAGESDGRMGFVIPKSVAASDVPEPAADNVQIRKRGAGRFAVIRFDGRMESGVARQQEIRLRLWMEKKGLIAEGAAEYAGYDPPWTPGLLRRNEVLIRLSPEAS